MGRSYPINPASETDPKALGDVYVCHVNEEGIVSVSVLMNWDEFFEYVSCEVYADLVWKQCGN